MVILTGCVLPIIWPGNLNKAGKKLVKGLDNSRACTCTYDKIDLSRKEVV